MSIGKAFAVYIFRAISSFVLILT